MLLEWLPCLSCNGARADNHGVHTERGLRPNLKWTTLLSPPGDAGRSVDEVK